MTNHFFKFSTNSLLLVLLLALLVFPITTIGWLNVSKNSDTNLSEINTNYQKPSDMQVLPAYDERNEDEFYNYYEYYPEEIPETSESTYPTD